MLLILAQWLQSDFGFLRVVNYITFRAVMATLTALLIGLVFGPWVIRQLTFLKVGQAVRLNGPKTHLIKTGTHISLVKVKETTDAQQQKKVEAVMLLQGSEQRLGTGRGPTIRRKVRK